MDMDMDMDKDWEVSESALTRGVIPDNVSRWQNTADKKQMRPQPATGAASFRENSGSALPAA
jgi:hypothetical protein